MHLLLEFRIINDNYGHDKGDIVLKKVSDILSSHSRKNDIVGRWGGEEFLIICPHSSSEGTMQLAEKLRQKIADEQFEFNISGTASFGVAEYQEGDTSQSIFIRVDKALYAAKEKKKNKVVVA